MRATRAAVPFHPPKRRGRRPEPDDELGELGRELSTFDAGGIPGQKPTRCTVTTDGRDKLETLSIASGCAGGTLDELMKEACEMDKRGEMDYQFVFFALQGGNVYKQPTDVRDFDTVHESSVPYHMSRPDYKLHGTIVKMPLPQITAPSAIVCHVFKGVEMTGVVAAMAEDGYEQMYVLRHVDLASDM